MGTYDELIAHRLGVDDLCRHIGADSLAYLSEASMLEAIGTPDGGACTACYSGNYPIEIEGVSDKSGFEAVLA